MPLYLDIAAVRIQSYLARTRELRARRGASAVLAEATRLTPLDDGKEAPLVERLAGRARRSQEAGDADGVVNLIVDDPDRLDEVIREVFDHLRAELPGAEFQAAWGERPSYLEAYKERIKPKIAAGDVRAHLPAVDEFPAVSPCRFCRSAPAVRQRRPLGRGEDPQDVCADCLMRYDSETRTTGRTAERKLAAALGFDAADKQIYAGDFETLARLGDREHNHLATVYVDGNALGEFFDKLAKNPAADKSDISATLTKHTLDALATAARAVQPAGENRLAVVPHVVGGDDVLVSLPADFAWAFTRTFLETFRKLLAEGLAKIAAEAGIGSTPTASAGIVFAHASHPFNLVVKEAEDCLRQAKNAVGGREASVQFADITADGPDGAIPEVIRLDDLNRSATELDGLAALPRSARVRIAGILRSAGAKQAASELDRLGYIDKAQPFLPVTSDKGNTPQKPRIALSQALRITRWWRVNAR